MGYTFFTKNLVEKYILEYSPKSVIDLGAQNDFSYPTLPAPYISLWYDKMGVEYDCIDLNGENGAWIYDLGRDTDIVTGAPFDAKQVTFDFVVDAGTSEHVGTNGHFDWEAIYYCWRNKFNLCRTNGIIVSENPKTENWPSHGFQWYCKEFYQQIQLMSGLLILEIGEVCAMGNCETGMNVWCVQKKVSSKFPSLSEFKTLPLKQS